MPDRHKIHFVTRIAAFSLVLVWAVLVAAQQPGHAAGAEALGRISFPISCSQDAQPGFTRGVAWLHSFQYQAAEKAFAEVVQSDPKCAMAYWGLAVTLYHPLWEGASTRVLKKGREYIEKAKRVGTKDARERDYINAAAAFYEDAGHSTDDRVSAYRRALGELRKHYPDDADAAAFYGLELLAASSQEDQNRKEAIAVLSQLCAAYPEHPGAAHYLIHAADTPDLAAQGLDAARRYARLAPSSSHALHMPSHIFVRLGLWQESIESNRAAAVAAAEATRQHLGEPHYQFHALDFLDYSYLQAGEEAAARRVIAELDSVPEATAVSITNARVMMLTRNAVETHHWREAATLAPEGGASDRQLIYWARTIASARMEDSAAAEKGFKELKKLDANARKEGQRLEDVRRRQAEAWLEFAKGRHDKALKIMRDAADREDADPGSFFVPAREMLADMLMELHQPDKALAEYEAELKMSPNRFNGLFGAANAARVAGDSAKAEGYMAKLHSICGPKADREELQNPVASTR